LTEYYLSTDQLDALCDLWISRLEKLNTPSNDSRAALAAPSSRETVQPIAIRTLDFLRVYAWLLQESWLDSSIVKAESTAKLDGWLARYEQVLQRGDWQSLPADLNDLKAWRKRAGWEYAGAVRKLVDAPKWLAGVVPAQNLATQLLNSPSGNSGKSETWLALQKLVEEMQSALPGDTSGDSQLMRSVRRSISYWKCLLEHFADPQSQGGERLKGLESEHPRDPWWTYYSARFLSRLPDQRMEAELRWKRLATAFPAGSIGWLECRARQVQLLRTSGRTEAAQQLAELVLATTPNIDALWRTRFATTP
jgi:hypothetical protein